jgi:hypothetical protein
MGKSYNKLNDGELLSIIKSNDIIMLTETWLNEFCNFDIEGYKTHFIHRTQKKLGTKRDSGGLLIYVSDKLSNKVHFAKSYEDSILWIKLDKELFDFSEDVLLCLCYNIPAGSSRQLFVNENIFDKIVEDILFFNDKYTNCNFVITGDLNARIGLKPDYVENEYLCNLDFMPDDYVEDGILPRNSQDKTINDEGKLLLNFCKLTGLRVCNGRVLDDKQGKYTCVKSAGSSVVDYVLCKPELFSFFSKFQVLDPNIWSDHCMINFTLGTIGCHQKEISETSKSYEQLEYVYKWDKDKQITYENVLNSETYFNDFQHLIGSLSNMQDKTQIDENLQTFYLVIDEVCSPLFRKNVKSNKVAKPITKISQPWYDHACKEKQKHFYDNLNIFRMNKVIVVELIWYFPGPIIKNLLDSVKDHMMHYN